MHGYGQEIYCLPLADCFVNQPFSHVSNTLYQEHGLCVFALDTETSAERKKQERLRKKIKGKKMSELRRKLLLEQNVKRQVLMNPKHYFIRSRDRAFVGIEGSPLILSLVDEGLTWGSIASMNFLNFPADHCRRH